MLDVRNDFPILKRKINGKRLVYLDNAATTQKPKQVIDSITNFYENHNANVHRAIHKLSEEATELYDKAREDVAKFIGARSDEIIFTKSSTEGINLIANSGLLKEGDEVIVTILEHHSNMVPWLKLKEKGIIVKFVDINDDGTLDYDSLIDMVNGKTKLISIVHVSNSLGTVNGVKGLVEDIKMKCGVEGKLPYILVDGAQSIGHMDVKTSWGSENTEYIDFGEFDFLVFSGHKMFGPTGIGVLYVNNHTVHGDLNDKTLMEFMEPLMKGGDMIKSVTPEKVEYAEGPQKFEGGTQNISGVIGLGEAVRYINKIGIDKIREHDKEIIDYALKELSKIDGVTIYGPKNSMQRSGSISFNIEGVHSHDVAQILSDEGVCIRSGHLCTQPIMKRLGIGSICRASFHIYNTKEDVDALVNGIKKVKEIFGV